VVGITPNFNGQTSQLYGGINYKFSLSNGFTDPLIFNLTKTLFFSGVLGPAVHNGFLKKRKPAANTNKVIVDMVTASCRGSLSRSVRIFRRIRVCPSTST